MTIENLRYAGNERLTLAGIEDSKNNADILLSFATGISREELVFNSEKNISEDIEKRYFYLIDKRLNHIPLQHILGVSYFYGNEFKVNKNVLVPRFETEILVELASKNLSSGASVLDICTGSGCIIISLAKLYKEKFSKASGNFVAADISALALDLARENAHRHDINIRFLEGDLFSPIQDTEKFDIITGNPPYIESDIIDSLSIEVREYDPRIALDGGEDGLYFYRKIAEGLNNYLKKGGIAFFEIGHNQGRPVKDIFYKAGYEVVNIYKDYGNYDRIIEVKG